jgi:hypothetical protein
MKNKITDINFRKKCLKSRIIYILLLFFGYCAPATGDFGWAVTSDQGKEVLEKVHFQITDYKMMEEDIIFSPSDTIHYVYKFKWSLFQNNYSPKDEFYVSLEKESLGFVEIEFKKKFIDMDSFSLKDKFSNLEIGRYNLKIAYDEEVLDSIFFEVVPEDGYPLREDLGIDEDEIIRYSR